METPKTSTSTSVSAKFPLLAIVGRIYIWIQSIFTSASAPVKGGGEINPPVVTAVALASEHDLLISLLNDGKHYDEAQVIQQTAKEWNLDMDLLDPQNLSVKGKSVWINGED